MAQTERKPIWYFRVSGAGYYYLVQIDARTRVEAEQLFKANHPNIEPVWVAVQERD